MSYLYIFLVCVFFLLFSFQVRAVDNDPTKPLVRVYHQKITTKKQVIKGIKKQPLTAIFIKQGNHQAIINDKLYTQGDYFSGKKIIAINSNSVLLKNSNGLTRLTLIKSIKKLSLP